MDRVQAIRLAKRLKRKRAQPDALTIIWLKWKTKYLFKRIHQSKAPKEECEQVKSTGMRMKNSILLLRKQHAQTKKQL
jgi:hypothetical protein